MADTDKAPLTPPTFTIDATDRLAPAVVRLWADLLEEHNTRRGDPADIAKLDDAVAEARTLAMRMARWPKRTWGGGRIA